MEPDIKMLLERLVTIEVIKMARYRAEEFAPGQPITDDNFIRAIDEVVTQVDSWTDYVMQMLSPDPA